MPLARSFMGSFCPRANVREEEVFVAVKTFLDSSGKPDKQFVTLAGFAANDATWDGHPGQDTITMRTEDLIHFVFDRDEYFYQPFKNQWNRAQSEAEETGKISYWQLVASITEARMQTTPGIQAADMLAWSINRENTAALDQQGAGLATILRKITAGWEMTCDEAFIRRFLESENEREEKIRSGDEYDPPRRSESDESCD
jgi:hypothetical protein